MLHLFIDTNVYLTFFGFTSDDLEELHKLSVAITSEEARLWTTGQVKDEFQRRREGMVAESLQALKAMKPNEKTPQMARNLSEFDEMMDAKRDFVGHLNAVEERLTSEFWDRSLAADTVLDDLMSRANEIAVTDDILSAARRRKEVGNPPGKRASLGDEINWECLLTDVPDGETLHLVTDDRDFSSDLRRGQISAFLADEWRERKKSDVHLYPRISAFFEEKFPDIKLATELEKELRVRALAESPSFEETHRAIRRLRGYADLSEQQVRDLFEASLHNSQIRWIANDHDVRGFLRDLVDENAGLFDDSELARFAEYFGTPGEEERTLDDDIPF